jgi:hypothetical protein
MNVMFLQELPADKDAFRVAIHDWQRKRLWLKLKLAGLLFVLFACAGVPAGGMVLSQLDAWGQEQHTVLLPLVVQGPVWETTLGESYDQ